MAGSTDTRRPSYGMALAHCHGYLASVLPQVPQAVAEIRASTPATVSDKLVILIPESCQNLQPETYRNIAAPSPPIQTNIKLPGGATVRLNAYNVTNPQTGKVYCVLIDQPRAMGVFLNMLADKRSISTKEEMLSEVALYRKYIEATIRVLPGCTFSCALTQIPEKVGADALATLICEELEKGGMNDVTVDTTVSLTYGLAISYCYSYLAKILPKLTGSSSPNVHSKLVVLVPESCRTLDLGAAHNISAQPQLECTVNIPFPVKLGVFKITEPGSNMERYVMMEQPKILSTLLQMQQLKQNIVSDTDRVSAVQSFIKDVDEILQTTSACRDQYQLVTVPGHCAESKLAEVICQQMDK